VVPGFGSIGGPEVLGRQRRFLLELRRQVGYLVAQGRPLTAIRREARIEPEWLVWMPYDHPSSDDIDHVHRELTVPQAPFRGQPFLAGEPRPRALALIGDRFHEPGHLEAGLSRALEKAGVPVRFAVDVQALSAASLKEVDLLVILRDGMLWPDPDRPHVVWMTPEQEQAVVAFVEGGGGLLALHNSPGLYPEGGPYLRLLGATFKGHGPLEEFRVRVLDPHHPITRGVSDYEIADEQHVPLPDRDKVHLLLESRSEEGVVGAAGWAYEPKKGRVAYLANGHTRDALVHPQFQLLLQNAARWCIRRDAPGAP
jgi:type 1 glutamine amidotransferase